MDRFPYPGTRAMAWAFVAMLLPLTAARAQTFPTVPRNLSGTSHAEIPAVAVGPSGDINVVWLDSGAILFRRSPADGGAFSDNMKVTASNLPSIASPPQIAVNSAGVYVAWGGTNNAGGGDIFFSSLATNTNSWTPPFNVSNGKGIASGSSAPVPRIATDPSGGVDVVWGQNGAFFARTTDSGSSFAVTQLSSSGMASVSPRMAINTQGHVFVVWENAGSCPTISFGRSIDKGGSFTPYSVDDTLTTVSGQRETGCASDVQIAVRASDNSIWLLWANDSPIQDLIITYAIDRDPFTSPGSTTFPEGYFNNLSSTSSHTPQMAIDATGDIDVVWVGDYHQNGGPPAVYFTRSTNPEDAASFCGGQDSACKTPPILTDPPVAGLATGFPQIAAEPTGAIDLLWQQGSVANPSNAYDIVLARSTDGSSFQQFRLDNSPTVSGNTGQVAVDGSGAVYAVWTGNSGSTADIFLSGDSTALTNPGISGLTASVTPASATISVGGSWNFTVSLSSTNGFSGPVTLTCGGAPAGVSCSFSPSSVAVPGAAMLNVSVSAKPSASALQRWPGVPDSPSGPTPVMTAWMWAIAAVIFLATLIASRRNGMGASMHVSRRASLRGLSYQPVAFARPLALMLLLAVVAAGLTSCGGSTNGGGGGGGGSITFPLTIQARSNSATTNLQTISITVP